jgi:hypothetical protein
MPLPIEEAHDGSLMRFLRNPENHDKIVASMPNAPMQAKSMLYFDFCN